MFGYFNLLARRSRGFVFEGVLSRPGSWEHFGSFLELVTWSSLQAFGTCEVTTVCKFFALVNWSNLQVFGICELTAVWSSWYFGIEAVCKQLALVSWQQFASSWHLWVGAVCKLLPLVNWQQLLVAVLGTWDFEQFTSIWHLVVSSLHEFGTCELTAVCKILALVKWQVVDKMLALVNWRLFARCWNLWTCESVFKILVVSNQSSLQDCGTCNLTAVCKILIFVNS